MQFLWELYLYFFVEIKDFMQELWSLDMVFSSMARVCDPIRNFDKRNLKDVY